MNTLYTQPGHEPAAQPNCYQTGGGDIVDIGLVLGPRKRCGHDCLHCALCVLVVEGMGEGKGLWP